MFIWNSAIACFMHCVAEVAQCNSRAVDILDIVLRFNQQQQNLYTNSEYNMNYDSVHLDFYFYFLLHF